MPHMKMVQYLAKSHNLIFLKSITKLDSITRMVEPLLVDSSSMWMLLSMVNSSQENHYNSATTTLILIKLIHRLALQKVAQLSM